MKPLPALRAPAGRRADPDVPAQPVLTALPELTLALLALGVGLVTTIAWRWTLSVAAALLVVALLRATRSVLERARRRRIADEWLLWGAAARPSSALLSWRACELMSPRLRRTLARSMRRIERETRGVAHLGAVPLNKRALRRQLNLVHAVNERLADRARPVSVRGILLVDRLLTEPGSPLYSRASDDVLAQALTDVLAALDPVSIAVAA
jgi:hypothetical protein